MKSFLLVTLAFAATLYAVSAQHRDRLPSELINRARELIHVAEQEMHKHHSEGRHHLTQQLQHEIQEVRKLERELLALEQHTHLEVHHVAEVEERLLHHENLLMEALVTIIHEHARERESREGGDEQ